MRDAISRRGFIGAAGGTAASAVMVGGTSQAAHAKGHPAKGHGSRYAPDGVAGRRAAFALSSVRLLDGVFRDNQHRNSNYLRFVDPDRLLHTYRLNVGLPSSAQPCGGWEAPDVELRGHSTGHLMSGLAITYANTGDRQMLDKGRYLVAELAKCQAASPSAGFHTGYLSAFPESFFDRLEAGTGVWAPYYTIHKIMAGLIDQHELTGNRQALHVAQGMGDWVAWRTGRLTDDQMQQVMRTEFGGINESLTNLYLITGTERYLRAAERFYHHAIFDPLAANRDELSGHHANTQIPKMIGCIRIWEQNGEQDFHDIGANFWRIVVDHHTYAIGGNSNGEAFHDPDVIAGQLSNNTCENCNSYNMLKLTRLLHFHQPHRIDLLDYYERALFNQMLGEQDPKSSHGFNIYYTGLSPAAFKQQPSFMGPNPNVYSTDYDNFSCDHGTGMETQAKYADTIYSHDDRGIYVNLFIPSEVTWADRDVTLRQRTGFPDEAATHLAITRGSVVMTLRVRIPSWVTGNAEVKLNGHRHGHSARPGEWLTVRRRWRTGDTLDVTLPMKLHIEPTPDVPTIQAVMYGPIVLAGAYGDTAAMAMPRLATDSVERKSDRLLFRASADDKPVTLAPIARTHHQHYTVYWRTGDPPPPPPEFAAWYKLDETGGTTAADATGNGKTAALVGGAAWLAGGAIGGAVQLDGDTGYVRAADGLLNGASAFSIATWVKLDKLTTWTRVFDFGTGTTAYAFLTPRAANGKMRYAITAGGAGAEQQINVDPPATGVWTHLALTYGDGTATLYVDGEAAGSNTGIIVEPRMFADHIDNNYLGKSQYADPNLPGAIDDVRVYGKTLTATEVATLATR